MRKDGTYNLWLNKGQRERLDRLAAKEDCRISEIVRDAIDHYLAKKEAE